MTRADVLDLAHDLAGGLVDPVQLAGFYDATMHELARHDWMVGVTLIEAKIGKARYELPDRALRILGVLFGAQHLTPLYRDEIDQLDPDWRHAVGEPSSYLTEDEFSRTFRLYPAPSQETLDGLSFPTGTPFGRDLPPATLAVIHTEARVDPPPWLVMPLALLTIAREFFRESDHTDPALSQAANNVASLWLEALNAARRES